MSGAATTKEVKTPNGRTFSLDEDGYISGTISVDLSEIVGRDLESFLDLISDKLTGSDLLMDSSYEVVGAENGSVVLKVSGDPSEVLTCDDASDPSSPSV